MAYEGLAESLLNTRTNVKQKAEANQAIAQAKSPMFNFGEQFADVYSKSTAPVTAANTADEIGHEYTIDPMREELARKLGNKEWNATLENFNKSFNRLRELEAAKENKLYNVPAVKTQKIVEVPEANVDVPGLIKKNSANININDLKTVNTGWAKDDKRWDILNTALQQGQLQKIKGGWYVGPPNKGATITDDILNAIIKASNIAIPTMQQTITEEVKPGGFEGLTPEQIDEKINFWRRELEKHRKNINTKIPGRSELADLVELKLKEDELAARKRAGSGGGSDNDQEWKTLFDQAATTIKDKRSRLMKDMGFASNVTNDIENISIRILGRLNKEAVRAGDAQSFQDDLANRLPDSITKDKLNLIDLKLRTELERKLAEANDPGLTPIAKEIKINSILAEYGPLYADGNIENASAQILGDQLLEDTFTASGINFSKFKIPPSGYPGELKSSRDNFRALVLNYLKSNNDSSKIRMKDLSGFTNIYKNFRDQMSESGVPIAKGSFLGFNKKSTPEEYGKNAKKMLYVDFMEAAPSQEQLNAPKTMTPEQKAWVDLFYQLNGRMPGKGDVDPQNMIDAMNEFKTSKDITGG